MAIAWASPNSSTHSLSQKLRDLGRLKSSSEVALKPEKEFEIVHTPDRPARLITSTETPTEEECGAEIARWQRASAKAHDTMFSRYKYESTPVVSYRSIQYINGRAEEEEQHDSCTA